MAWNRETEWNCEQKRSAKGVQLGATELKVAVNSPTIHADLYKDTPIPFSAALVRKEVGHREMNGTEHTMWMHHTIQHLERPTMKPWITCQRARKRKRKLSQRLWLHVPIQASQWNVAHTCFVTHACIPIPSTRVRAHTTHTNNDEKPHPLAGSLERRENSHSRLLPHTGPWNSGTHEGHTHAAFFPQSNRTENTTQPHHPTMAPTLSLRIHGTLG